MAEDTSILNEKKDGLFGKWPCTNDFELKGCG